MRIYASDGRELKKGDTFTHGYQSYKFEYADDNGRVHVVPIGEPWRTGSFAEGRAEGFGLRVVKEPPPRVWTSLVDVPDDVEVYDTGYRIWYVREGYGERYYRAGNIPVVWDRPAMQGPFTEVN